MFKLEDQERVITVKATIDNHLGIESANQLRLGNREPLYKPQ